VGVKSKKVRVSDNFSIDCHTTIDAVQKTDLLLIPAIEFDVENKIEKNKALTPHILRLHKKGTEIGSMCTGAFFLASIGLLNGKTATTHWFTAGLFRQMFPEVKMKDDRVVVDEGGIYTCGGATSFLNLCLYLVEKFCGKETAVMTSKMLLLDFDKTNQSHYSIFFPQYQHQDADIRNAQHLIEQHGGKKMSVDSLAGSVALSKRNFIRRFKAATGNTPLEYMQRVNVEKAKRKLETGNETLEQIVYSLGYSDINSFRGLFKKTTGLSPMDYRRKYKRAV